MDSQKDPEIQRLYQLNKHQLSDLLFMEEELRFLKSILNKYFSTIVNDVYLNRIPLISSELTQLGMVKSNVVKDILLHQQNLESGNNDILKKSTHFLKIESDRIEYEIRDIHKCFRNIKKEIFTIYKNSSAKCREEKNS
ncbi:MAG TPA: hypothetical protein VGD22_14780 [Sphingobacteriaceae bacterium]